MERIRPFLMITLIFLGLLLWQAWEDQHNNKTIEALSSYQLEPSGDPVESNNELDVPRPPKVFDDTNLQNQHEGKTYQAQNVETDIFKLAFSTKGGSITELSLRKYPTSLKQPKDYIEMLNISESAYFGYQNGLAGNENLPTHNSIYTLDSITPEDELKDGKTPLEVIFNHTKNGVSVKKVYTIQPGSYLINVAYSIKNNSSSSVAVYNYEQLKRKVMSSRNGLIYTYAGAVFSTPDKRFEKYDFDDLLDTPIKMKSQNSWIGNMQHYFVAALVPPAEKEFNYYSKTFPNNNQYTVGLVSDGYNIKPNSSIDLTTTLYIGPKTQPVLEKIAPGLDLTVDYGILWFLSKPLFLTLSFIHDIVNNWGWAIILLTILIKLIFYPLSAAGYKSMAKLKTVQPKMMAIKERYSSDKTQMNQAMMKLYKEEKINPLGGCFPILIQIPVFIALYWVLLESVEMRQAPFFGWIDDLSSKDPFFVLPVLMGLSMWFQQKLNPPPVDPIQAKVMQFLPIMFTAFFAFFPSGLVLYWLGNKVLSILQQWRITQQIQQK